MVDTDVIVIAAYVSTISIWYRRKQNIKCSNLYPNEVANVLIGFCALIDADAAAGFYCQ